METNVELFDLTLAPNPEALREMERAVAPLPVDDEFNVWSRANRLALRRGPITRVNLGNAGRAVIELPLRCVAHPHPECRFRYVQLVVDFGFDLDDQPQRAIVEDISPRYVEGEEPVKIITKRAGEIKFELETIKLGPGLSVETTREQDVYFPLLRGSGEGFEEAVWTFEAVGDAPLHLDRDLRLLVSFPIATVALNADFRLEARVAMQGLGGWLPLVGNRKVRLEAGDLLKS